MFPYKKSPRIKKHQFLRCESSPRKSAGFCTEMQKLGFGPIQGVQLGGPSGLEIPPKSLSVIPPKLVPAREKIIFSFTFGPESKKFPASRPSLPPCSVRSGKFWVWPKNERKKIYFPTIDRNEWVENLYSGDPPNRIQKLTDFSQKIQFFFGDRIQKIAKKIEAPWCFYTEVKKKG